MKKEYLETSLHGEFEKVNDEFLKCTISVLTADQVANRTKFTEDAIIKALPTLNYAPVIGYIKEDEFTNHAQEIVINDDGEYEVRVMTRPYGVVIKDSQRFVDMVKDNGETEKYLLVDCYLWKRYEDAIDTVKENLCNQSMEVTINSYDYKDSYLEVTDFNFSALCILGEDVTPAFNLAKIRTSSQFSQDEFKEQYESMIFSLNKYLDTFAKEVDAVEEIKDKEQEFDSTEKVEEEFVDGVCPEHNCPLEDGKCPQCEDGEEDFATKKKKRKCEGEDTELEVETLEKDDKTEEDEDDFAKKKKRKCTLDEIQETEEFQALVSENEGLKAKYSQLETEFNNSTIELGKANVELTRVNSEFTKVEEELVSLREFKNNVETKERKEKIDAHINEKFSFVPEIDMAEAREKAYSGEISMDEFDNAIYITMGRKGLFSLKTEKKEEKNESMRLFSNAKNENNEECEYASIAHLFTKRD